MMSRVRIAVVALTAVVLGAAGIVHGSALHVMLFLENILQVLFIFNGLRRRHCQRALLGYHYHICDRTKEGGALAGGIEPRNTSAPTGNPPGPT